MHRLFVAIRPPRPVREHLLSIMGGVQGARWQDDDQLHLTVRFIGEIDRRRAEDVAAALAAIRHQEFDLTLSTIGSFERRGHSETLWTGIVPEQRLKRLHDKADQACVRAGLPPERRAYHPHITLARLGRDAGPVDALVEQSSNIAGLQFTVQSFGLFESSLTPQGAVYTLAERYRLDPAP